MIFNLKYKPERAVEYLNEQIKAGAIIEMKNVAQTRSSLQNMALHLFFTQVSKELNNIGIPFVYTGLKGIEMETQWTPELFKTMTWKPLQKAMFGTDSTRQLKRNQIDPIFEVLNKFFAERGISVQFPNQFDLYLKFCEK
ncbi:MAG TPA: hypothetical protein VN192_02850 [Flavobacterium sp.]|nr:hypothetical protein [Flavobacterium sp.]